MVPTVHEQLRGRSGQLSHVFLTDGDPWVYSTSGLDLGHNLVDKLGHSALDFFNR
jgi:hypothetical protein